MTPTPWSGREEPLLDEVLSDPIVRAVMRRDGLERADLEKIVQLAPAAKPDAADAPEPATSA